MSKPRSAAETDQSWAHDARWNGVLNGKGASLLDGYMEDLATDRIYRLMLSQRLKHHERAPIVDAAGARVALDDSGLTRAFDDELERLLAERGRLRDAGDERTFREARGISEDMIRNGWFNPL